MTDIHLGYEVGKGTPVAVPLKHMVITGQTQEAGKTTTLEALIARSGLRALTFITKRGEGSFRGARRTAPYFREQADWQFVASILEASRGEKLKFERAWIIRASKGARSLADVQRNVRKAMETAKGMSADVYLTLDAYLEAVVPQIARVKWAQRVALEPGINVMDLTGLNVEMQHLVIKSSLDWVLERETNTVIVVPEAWKFIPQGRGTPVKLAAESFIRQAAGLGNYLWLDSQDIAGVEKIILKSVPLWVLGVQREANEIKRTLDNIPAGIKKPKADQVAQLGLGQFYACWGTEVHKVYVQPNWMSEDQARHVAMGKGKPTAPPPAPVEKESEEDMSLDREYMEKTTTLLERMAQLLENHALHHEGVPPAEAGPVEGPGGTTRFGYEPARATPVDEDALYQRILARLRKEAPAILKTIDQVPELHVTIEQPVVEVDGKTLRGRLVKLLSEGFFDKPTTGNAAYNELQRTGFGTAKPNVYNELNRLTELGAVTKEPMPDGKSTGYVKAPGIKIVRKER